ncbi:glycosyltransferase family 4 protein [Pseudomonas shirazica]|uniref:glycosyltransferase family 4 protein n=1 Tax=Pseudomonas shirazica TaxID=1940636 RepID=UPI001EDE89A6|nr:glycosyltransferase family 4 protein [Pseudomonas shirazica]
MKPRILLLTFYYPPDLSAGSFRVEALVNALRTKLGDEVEIDIITTTPNRYNSYVTEAESFERFSTVNVRRITVPRHKGFIGQAYAFAIFALRVLSQIKKSRYDLVFATSSRLMTALLGAIVSRKAKAPLYLDIRDIFAETVPDLFPCILGKPIALFFSMLERWTIKSAKRVNLISPGFTPYFESRYPSLGFTTFTNGIDEIFLAKPLSTQYLPPNLKFQKKRILYAGNIGTGQGLDLIIPSLAKQLEQQTEFHIIGAGGTLKKLEAAIRSLNVKNVIIHPPISRTDLLVKYNEADILFLHLNDLKAFRRVLPSKLFEYAASQKPIWAGLSGFSARFARNRIQNIALFNPCDIESAIRAFYNIELRPTSRDEFIQQYSRPLIKKEMAEDIISTSSRLNELYRKSTGIGMPGGHKKNLTTEFLTTDTDTKNSQQSPQHP